MWEGSIDSCRPMHLKRAMSLSGQIIAHDRGMRGRLAAGLRLFSLGGCLSCSACAFLRDFEASFIGALSQNHSSDADSDPRNGTSNSFKLALKVPSRRDPDCAKLAPKQKDWSLSRQGH